MTIAVTGATGFIGQPLCRALRATGYQVRGVGRRPARDVHEFVIADLREPCPPDIFKDIEVVYALAADMGGVGYISQHPAQVLHNNALITLHTIEAARLAGVRRYILASSACVYPAGLQTGTLSYPLREADAYPANPLYAYGWEKLLAERLCLEYAAAYGMETRIARFHSVYGPCDAWTGGREKVPAAACRKIAEAVRAGRSSVAIFGDGSQVRSFCYVTDAVDALIRMRTSDYPGPINIGGDEPTTTAALYRRIAAIAGLPRLTLVPQPAPPGVQHRLPDLALAASALHWTPTTGLQEGLEITYRWVAGQLTDVVRKEAR